MTAQIHEILIIDGQKTSMAFCPEIPLVMPEILIVDEEEMVASKEDFILQSTACWRGYQGTWEIRDGEFYLVDVRGRFQLRSDGPLKATWFSGVIRVPKGEMLQYVHMGFGSVYEEELHIKIDNGCVTDTRVVDNRGNQHDEKELGWNNLPGQENRFPGDDAM